MDLNSIVNIAEILSIAVACVMWFAKIKNDQKNANVTQSELHEEYKIVTKKIELLSLENAQFRTEIEVLKIRVTMMEDKD